MYRQAGTPRGPVQRRLYGGRAVRNLVGRHARRRAHAAIMHPVAVRASHAHWFRILHRDNARPDRILQKDNARSDRILTKDTCWRSPVEPT